MRVKKDYTDYIMSVCEKKTIKELKKIVKYLDDGDTLSIARNKKNEKIEEIKAMIISEIKEMGWTKRSIEKEETIREKYGISRSTFYKYLKESRNIK